MSDLTAVIQSRRTDKVLGDPDRPLEASGDHRSNVDALLAGAGQAPYHFPNDPSYRTAMNSPVPWRFYKVDSPGCRKLMAQLASPDAGAGKIAAMLAAADALLLVTWQPEQTEEKPAEGHDFVASQRNMEHIAASAAAVQSLLLMATDHGYRTYWSSGGLLRDKEMFEQLGIDQREVLLGAIFLFPQNVGEAQVKAGAWRDKRGTPNDWSVWVDV
jgi:nitroreductase